MPANDQIRRVLLYRLGSLGDMAIAVPVLRLVARAFPHAERRMLTNVPVHAKAPAAEAVLDGSGLVKDYFRYTVGTRNPLELARLVIQVRLWRPEVAVYLAAARGTAAAARDVQFLRLCGVPRVIGAPLTETLQSNFFGEEPASPAARERLWTGDLEPEAERLARCVEELGDAGLQHPASWALGLTEAERHRARGAAGEAALQAGGGPVAVSVGTKVQAKDWGVERWRALLGQLAPRCAGRSLLLLGAPEEGTVSTEAAADWVLQGGGPVVNLCGRLSPRESAAALEGAVLFLGHDSGPMHLAASVGTPIVAVFAARNLPRQWFPGGGGVQEVVYHRVECAGCGLETCVEQRKKCILSIGVDEVLAAAVRVLERGRL